MSRAALVRGVLLPLLSLIVGSCSGAPARDSDPENYLRANGFEVAGNEVVLLRWPVHRMPLKVFLPLPPAALFDNAEELREATREGVLAWEGLAGAGLPTFEFVSSASEADIPIVWAEEPDGDWYIAHCAYNIQPFARRFGINRILITGRWNDGEVAPLAAIRTVMIHEVGHALGLRHSASPFDIMYPGYQEGVYEPSFRDETTLRLLYESPIGRRVGGASRVR